MVMKRLWSNLGFYVKLEISNIVLKAKATLIGTRMTRMKRIYADFDPACGVIGIGLATNCTNFHKFRHKLRLRESALT